MKKAVLLLVMSIVMIGTSFASFPVSTNEAKKEISVKKATKKSIKAEKKQVKVEKKVAKMVAKLKVNNEGGGDYSTAFILGLVSLFIPFALHNWYLEKYKKATIQSLMAFPGILLFFLPFFASWIWQIIDTVKIFEEL